MRKILLYVCSALLLTACSNDDDDVTTGGEVSMSLCASVLDVKVEPEATDTKTKTNTKTKTSENGTRATEPYTPDIENLIHDIWIIPFSENGVRQVAYTRHYRMGEKEGTMCVSDLEVTLFSTPSIVCILANTGDNTLAERLPDNLPDYQKMLMSLGVTNNGTADRDKMVLNGYWVGTPSASHKLNVELGRMMTRINLTVSNQTGAALTNATFSLTNIPDQAYLYPQFTEAIPTEAYLTDVSAFTWTVASIAKGVSQPFYFYLAPNICNGNTSKATTLQVTSGAKTWTVLLGADKPGTTTDRDLNLYPNSMYYFTVNLK